jgi:hypothetical protein
MNEASTLEKLTITIREQNRKYEMKLKRTIQITLEEIQNCKLVQISNGLKQLRYHNHTFQNPKKEEEEEEDKAITQSQLEWILRGNSLAASSLGDWSAFLPLLVLYRSI